MANWAFSTVIFQGEETKIEEINTMFEKMMEDEEHLKKGQLPFFVMEKQGYLSSIRIDEREDESIEISYETRWSPNLPVLIEIANHFNVDFEVSYKELGQRIFGKATFKAGDLDANINELEDADFEKYEHLEDEDIYMYNNAEWVYFNDMLEAILEDKIDNISK